MSETEELTMAEWLALDDVQQLRAVSRYLGPAAKERSIAHGRVKNHRYSLSELTQMRADQPAFPEGSPTGNWSDEQLRAFIDVHDAQIAAQPKPTRRLRVDQLNDQQLKRLAAVMTQAQVDQLLDEFSNNMDVR